MCHSFSSVYRNDTEFLTLPKEQVTLTIKSSPRLRALVPQVYGLGDLSSILDLRAIEQTKAILKGWLPKLKAYVPTNAHNRAVRILDKHGIVLLLGNPASGKSTIGAILSTMAVEDEDHSVIQISTPQEFVQHWNPDDKNRFFWIDDAFGSNVVDPVHIPGYPPTYSDNIRPFVPGYPPSFDALP